MLSDFTSARCIAVDGNNVWVPMRESVAMQCRNALNSHWGGICDLIKFNRHPATHQEHRAMQHMQWLGYRNSRNWFKLTYYSIPRLGTGTTYRFNESRGFSKRHRSLSSIGHSRGASCIPSTRPGVLHHCPSFLLISSHPWLTRSHSLLASIRIMCLIVLFHICVNSRG